MLYAIVVGINSYRDPQINDLSFAYSDAVAIANLLEQRIHPTDLQLQCLYDQQATQHSLRVAIGETLPRMVTPNDSVLIYIASHGSPEMEAAPDTVSRYLIAHDTEYANIYATGIDLEREIPRWFQRLQSPRWIILFIDACFSGRAGGRTFEGPQLKRFRDDHRTTGPIRLRNFDFGSGRLMIAACDDDQIAREDPTLGRGIFTHFLLEGLTRTGRNQALVSVYTLYDEIARGMRFYTKGRQLPVINGRGIVPMLPNLAVE